MNVGLDLGYSAIKLVADGGCMAAQALVGSLQFGVLLPLPLGQNADDERHQVQEGNTSQRSQEKAPAEKVLLQGQKAQQGTPPAIPPRQQDQGDEQEEKRFHRPGFHQVATHRCRQVQLLGPEGSILEKNGSRLQALEEHVQAQGQEGLGPASRADSRLEGVTWR